MVEYVEITILLSLKAIMLAYRRLLGLLAAASPFAVVMFCGLSDWRLGTGNASGMGYLLLTLGWLISIFNFYLHVLRHPIHCLIHGKDAEYKWISGAPLLGLLSVLGLALLPRSVWLSIIALILLCIDIGGIHWFVIFTWKDDSLWNPKKFEIDEKKKKYEKYQMKSLRKNEHE